MANIVDEKIQAIEKELARVKTIKQVYEDVQEQIEKTKGRSFKNPETEEWEYHEYTDEEFEAHECTNPFNSEVWHIWDSKEEVKRLTGIYNALLECLAQML